MKEFNELPASIQSPSSRRAWIEIATSRKRRPKSSRVALLAEGVDRNKPNDHTKITTDFVALLAEGVDRNTARCTERENRPVALLAEGVDRNVVVAEHHHAAKVALLAEGVDRNTHCRKTTMKKEMVALLAEGVDRNKEE